MRTGCWPTGGAAIASVPALRIDQIIEQLGLAVDRAMGEGSLYDKELAALAIVQARGDLIEAIFLVRAYRTTLPRFGYSRPIDTGAMLIERRISATYKDLPGGQLLGPTFDYTHRLLDPTIADGAEVDAPVTRDSDRYGMPRVTDLLGERRADRSRWCVRGDEIPAEPRSATSPASRSSFRSIAICACRLWRAATRAFCSRSATRRSAAMPASHPFVGEIRIGEVEVELDIPELGFAVSLGRIRVTECQMVNQFKGSAKAPPQFTRGYGLVFGQAERKAMAMALCDRALRARELGEDITAIAQDEEFVISHSDNVQATGFVEHLKLPHYVDFQAELDLIRKLRAEAEAAAGAGPEEFREAAE